MFILRSVNIDDLEALYELSKIQVFINLPANRDTLKEMIEKSSQSFKEPDDDLEKNYYIFVLEDLSTKKIIGTSMIHGKHGTNEEPHYYLRVGTENKYSESMHLGYIHKTLKLGMETDGWSEIGGLVLDPEYRGHAEKLGKQLSFVRFLYMGINPDRFTDIIHTELMPPFDEKGNSPLWEAIGRRFLHMDYNDADQRSRKNKEFILSLYPSDTIYETLLPLEARQSIGEVGKTTQPVKRMLEKIGFKYVNEVDPFDGGPHYRVALKDISLVKEMKSNNIKIGKIKEEKSKDVLITFDENSNYDFFAIKTKVNLNRDHILVDEGLSKIIDIKDDIQCNFIFF